MKSNNKLALGIGNGYKTKIYMKIKKDKFRLIYKILLSSNCWKKSKIKIRKLKIKLKYYKILLIKNNKKKIYLI